MLQSGLLVYEETQLSSAFITQARTALDSLPLGVQTLIKMAGYRIEIVPTIVARFPELVDKHPRGYPADATFEHVDGLTHKLLGASTWDNAMQVAMPRIWNYVNDLLAKLGVSP
jgi:hypothetical protein